MHDVDGYTLDKPLLTSRRSEVLAARRDRDGAPVVLKRYSVRGTTDDAERTRREYEVLRKLAAPGIVGALELVQAQGQTILVMEHAPGVPLSQLIEDREIDEAMFLWIAIAAAESLGHVHGQHHVHRDVKPRNILVSVEERSLHLIDFGIAAPLGQVARADPETTMGGLDGTLLYISPEQTGRMDRGIDQRSDLYSLGATLYHMLVGDPPFPLDDPLALIHAHIARTPSTPLDHRPELSTTLSRLVMKLLEKEPERRYQTATALANDLRACQAQRLERGEIDPDLVLGGGDGPYRPLFSSTLYGRESEAAQLANAYGTARDDGARMVVLSGPAGVGKSALVGSLRPPLADDQGALAVGRYDTYSRERPYSAIRTALDALVNQWLAEPEEQLAMRAARLRESLGGIAAVAIEMVPDLGLVLGEVPPVPALGPAETRNRLCLAMKRFAEGAATHEHPLVLQLDDLQWADAGSQVLIEAMLARPSSAALLVVATVDAGDESTTRKVAQLVDRLSEREVPVERIELGPLGADACAEMLAEALRRTPDDTRSLAECVQRKTGSYPLQVQQFVELLHGRGLIEYRHPTGWIWEETAVEGADIPDSAVAIMTEKISRLGGAMREHLCFASCVGDPFDIGHLCALSDLGRDTLETAVFELCDMGLLVPSHSGFRFSHDRIREAARALLPEDQLADLHYRIGMRLLALTPEGELRARAFDLADHLNRAADRLDASERAKACEVNVYAGMRALAEGAAATALEYFRCARDGIAPEFFETHPTLAFELYLQGAESALQTRDFDDCMDWLDVLEARGLEGMQAVRVTMKRIMAIQLHRPSQEALGTVLAAGARFGVRWPRHPSWLRVWLDIARTTWMLRRCTDEDFFRPVDPSQVQKLAPVFVLSSGGTALSRSSIRFVCMIASLALRTYHRHGYSYSPSFALAGFGAFRHAFLRGGKLAPQLAEAALQWSERVPDSRFGPRTEVAAHGYVGSWFRPRRGFAERLRPLAEKCLESGDLEYLAVVQQARANIGALSGEPLDAVDALFAEHARAASASPFVKQFVKPYAQLRSEIFAPEALSQAVEEAKGLVTRDSFVVYLALHWMVALTVFGRFDEALDMSDRVADFALEVSAMTSHVVDYMLFRALAASATAQEGRGQARKPARKKLRACHRYLERWSGYNPDFQHMAQLVSAERAALRGRIEEATGLYRSVASRAVRQGYPHHAALAHERRAALLRRTRREVAANAADADAMEQYRIWGANAKVALMQAAADRTRYE